MMPGNVRAGQVISLVEVTGGLGSAIDRVTARATSSAPTSRSFIPILDTAELLGLVKVEKGDISLTEFGQKFQKTSKNKVKLLTDQLAQDRAVQDRGRACQQAGLGLRRGGRARPWQRGGSPGTTKPEMNQSLLTTILIHWAIYAGLLNYNKSGRFEAIKRAH